MTDQTMSVIDPRDPDPSGTVEMTIAEYVAAGGDIAALRDDAARHGDDELVAMLDAYSADQTTPLERCQTAREAVEADLAAAAEAVDRAAIYRERTAAEAAAAMLGDPSIDGSDAEGEPKPIPEIETALLRADTFAAFRHAVADFVATVEAVYLADDVHAAAEGYDYTGDADYLAELADNDEYAEQVAAFAAETGDIEHAVTAVRDGRYIGRFDSEGDAAEHVMTEWLDGVIPAQSAEDVAHALRSIVIDWPATWRYTVRHDHTYHAVSGHTFRDE